MSCLKVHKRFHFGEHIKKKMHLTLQLTVYLTMQSRVHLWISLRVLYILYRAKQTELLTFSNCKPKTWKSLHQRCFPGSLPNITELFFAKHVWVVTASAKYHSLFLLHRPHQQNVTLDLGYILIIFKYFVACEQLFLEVLDNLADKTTNAFKMFLEIRSSQRAVFFKTYFL